APEIGFNTEIISKLDGISKGLHPLEYECIDISIDYCIVNMITISRDGFIDSDFAMPEGIEKLGGEIFNKLQKIIEEIPDFFTEKAEFDRWQEKYAFTWLEQYRQLAIKYRNIGFDWKFTDEQETILKLYYDANVLLVDCLVDSNHIVASLKQEIQETLLLPIAEIEKRKREKLEL
ncbi:MAG: hypothetical protein F6J86_45130, partial [Symploca sp. SIO1B1]|nr:hypothetical protein [Symploca sp. SIO1B1]